MKAFLKTVAQDMLAKYGTNMSDIAVVFPNKRAALSSTPIWRNWQASQSGLPHTSPSATSSADTPT